MCSERPFTRTTRKARPKIWQEKRGGPCAVYFLLGGNILRSSTKSTNLVLSSYGSFCDLIRPSDASLESLLRLTPISAEASLIVTHCSCSRSEERRVGKEC